MAQVVCIDTHIIIWGIMEEAKAGQEYRIPQAKHLLKTLEEKEATIIIPAIAAGEASIGVPVDQRQGFLNEIARRCKVMPYDNTAAYFYGTFFGENRQHQHKQELKESVHGYRRKAVNADSMILATALARKANILYTGDGPLRKIAQGLIEVGELPTPPPKPLSLFDIAK